MSLREDRKKIKQEMSTQEANDDIEQNGFLLH